MPRRVNMDSWGMCWEEYKELTFFCLQYEHKKREASALLTIRISTPEPEIYHKGGREYGVYMPHGSGRTSDPVASTAEKRDRLLRDVRIIEQAAKYTAEGTGISDKYILLAVTQRGGVEALYANPDTRPPRGRRQFELLRRKFFWVLREMRNGDLEPLP